MNILICPESIICPNSGRDAESGLHHHLKSDEPGAIYHSLSEEYRVRAAARTPKIQGRLINVSIPTPIPTPTPIIAINHLLNHDFLQPLIGPLRILLILREQHILVSYVGSALRLSGPVAHSQRISSNHHWPLFIPPRGRGRYRYRNRIPGCQGPKDSRPPQQFLRFRPRSKILLTSEKRGNSSARSA